MAGVRAAIMVTLLGMLAYSASGQNLVPNGDFEMYTSCPGSFSRNPTEFRLPSWRALTSGSPDYFNACSEGEAAVPYNWAGVSDAYQGRGYAGIYTFLSLKEYREYLHCKLTEPLVRDSLYRIEFRYKLSSYSKYSIDRIAVLVSDSLATVSGDGRLKISPTLAFVKDSALTPETGSWEEAVGEFRAAGGEQFLTIGNFDKDSETKRYYIRFRPAQEPMLADAAYYYIDDVRLLPLFQDGDKTEPPTVLTDAEPRLNTAYVLNNIQFAFNSHELLPGSYSELNYVVRHMRRNPRLKLRLSGHTDDVGDPSYNMELSLRRARSVAAYLVTQGIDVNRIVTRGYGETMPVVSGASAEDRRLNRRVEIEFFM